MNDVLNEALARLTDIRASKPAQASTHPLEGDQGLVERLVDALVRERKYSTKADEAFSALKRQHAAADVAMTDWEYEGRPYASCPDEPEWAGRGITECETLVTEYANPNHYVYAEHNSDLSPVVGFRVYRRRKAGPWEKAQS